MDFLVIKVTQQPEVDFLFEPTLWLEAINGSEAERSAMDDTKKGTSQACRADSE
jgi:hypothetical protein